MIQISCAALLFDMDGVLIDSTPAVARVWTRFALRHGFEAVEVVHRAHGRPSIMTVREYLPNGDHLAENKEIERGEIVDLEGIVPLPGTQELLGALPRGRWTIVTSCTRRLAEVRLKTSGLPRPEGFVTSSDIANGKPAPANPWNAAGLEWQTPSPPPTFNFDEQPVVTWEAYNYEEIDAIPDPKMGEVPVAR